jgi:hypothetical protein
MKTLFKEDPIGTAVACLIDVVYLPDRPGVDRRILIIDSIAIHSGSIGLIMCKK